MLRATLEPCDHSHPGYQSAGADGTLDRSARPNHRPIRLQIPMASPINWIVTLAHVHPSTAVLAAAMAEVVGNQTAILSGLVALLLSAVGVLLRQIFKNDKTSAVLTTTVEGQQVEIKALKAAQLAETKAREAETEALKTAISEQKDEQQTWLNDHYSPFVRTTEKRISRLKSLALTKEPDSPLLREWPKSNGR